MKQSDLCDLVRRAPGAYYDSIPPDRNPIDLHVSDIVACAHDVWRRRNGHLSAPHSPETMMMFRRGTQIEADMTAAQALAFEALGYETFHAAVDRYRVRFNYDREHGTIYGRAYTHAVGTLGDDWMIGETDFVAANAKTNHLVVIEIKSHAYLYPAPKMAHVYQLTAYASALSEEWPEYDVSAVIIDVSAVSGETNVHPIDWRAYEPAVVERIIERFVLTAPGVAAPAELPPPEAWQLKGPKNKKVEVNTFCDGYCRQELCHSNIAYRELQRNHAGGEDGGHPSRDASGSEERLQRVP